MPLNDSETECDIYTDGLCQCDCEYEYHTHSHIDTLLLLLVT